MSCLNPSQKYGLKSEVKSGSDILTTAMQPTVTIQPRSADMSVVPDSLATITKVIRPECPTDLIADISDEVLRPPSVEQVGVKMRKSLYSFYCFHHLFIKYFVCIVNDTRAAALMGWFD